MKTIWVLVVLLSGPGHPAPTVFDWYDDLVQCHVVEQGVLRNPFYKSAQCTYLEWPVMK